MKRIIAFIFLCGFLWVLWTFVILCPGTKAQWEDAEVQRLTYNTSVNKMVGLCIDKNEKLFLFYSQRWWDPQVQPYRDTLFLMTKEKEGEWSQPERISNSSLEMFCKKSVGYDSHTGLIHLFYECLDSVYGGVVYYTNSNMPNWETVKSDSGSDRVHVEAMAFDSLGNIHLVWNVDFDSLSQNWYRVMYANNSTGEWVKQQVTPSIYLGGMGSGTSYLGVQKNGTAHILYYGEGYQEFPTYYIRNDSLNGTNWHLDTIPRPSRPIYRYFGGFLKVDANDRVHLFTTGCIVDDYCLEPGWSRNFYYYKEAEDTIWQGGEVIPDTTLDYGGIDKVFIDKDGIIYASYFFFTNEIYFTDRKQGSWQVPYILVGYQETPDSFMVDGFCFVLDSEGRGHAAFSAFDFSQGSFDNDSLEIYYLSSSDSFVDTSQDNKIFSFKLIQNYPNPFNSSTIITYEILKEENVTLKIYDILGREVRELLSKSQKPGHYKVNWDGKNNQGKEVASGIYFYHLKAGGYKQTKRMLLIK